MINDLVVEFCLLTLFCCYLVHYYSGPNVSFYIKVCSVITWVLTFGIALLVPLDLYESLKNINNPQFESSGIFRQISIQYLVLYWTVYLLTWTVIPVLQQWQNSGDLQSKDRLMRSLKTNGMFYAVLLVIGILGLVFLIMMDAAKGMSLTTYLKALATSFGIFLLMLLLGYAIVEIPRSLWLQSQPLQYLHYTRARVSQIEDQLHEFEFQFKKIVSFVIVASKVAKQNEQIQKYCKASLSEVPPQLLEKIPKNCQSFLKETQYGFESYTDIQASIQHHRLMKRVLAHIRRTNKALEQFTDQTILYEDLQTSISNNSGRLETTLFKTNKFHWYWYTQIKPRMKKIGSVCFSIFSVIILISETQVFLTEDTSLLGWILKINDLNTIRLLSLVTISLLSYMVYYSLFRLKLSNLYGLYRKQSDGPSLMFATINFSRVGVALLFNFFDMIKIDSIFIKVMNAPDMGLLGDWVIKGMPGILWLIVLTHYFDVWGRLMNKLGFGGAFKFNMHTVTNQQGHSRFSIRRRRLQLQKKDQNRQFFNKSLYDSLQ